MKLDKDGWPIFEDWRQRTFTFNADQFRTGDYQPTWGTVIESKRGLCRALGLLDQAKKSQRVWLFNGGQKKVTGNTLNVACTVVGTKIKSNDE